MLFYLLNYLQLLLTYHYLCFCNHCSYSISISNQGFVFQPLMRRMLLVLAGEMHSSLLWWLHDCLFWCNILVAMKIIPWGYQFYDLEYRREEGQTILRGCFSSIDLKSCTCLFYLWLTWCKEEEDRMTGSRAYKTSALLCLLTDFLPDDLTRIPRVWNDIFPWRFVVLVCYLILS